MDSEIYEVIRESIKDLRRDITEDSRAFRKEVIDGQEKIKEDLVELRAGQVKLSTNQEIVLKRLDTLNGSVGEHDGMLKLHTGMLAGHADSLEKQSSALSDMLRNCVESRRVCREETLVRIDTLERKDQLETVAKSQHDKDIAGTIHTKQLIKDRVVIGITSSVLTAFGYLVARHGDEIFKALIGSK